MALRRILLPLLLLLAGWEAASWLALRSGTLLPQSKLPYAHRVLATLAANAPLLLRASLYTFSTALLGFLLGGALGFLIALLLSQSRILEASLLPYAVASQMIPILGLAPIIYGILRQEHLAKLVIAAYVTFFPVTVNCLAGLKSTDPTALDLLDSYAAPRRAIYWKLRVPASLPGLFTGLKLAAPASVIGAILVEVMGAQNGLGVLILRFMYYGASYAYQLWATLLCAVLLGIAFFQLISFLERRLVPWQPEFRHAAPGEDER